MNRGLRLDSVSTDMVRIDVDGRPVLARAGDNLLSALLDNGFYVPHLCFPGRSAEPNSACRLCFVEVAGHAGPVCACEVSVEEGMSVATATPRASQLATRALNLLASRHVADCAHCPKRQSCPFREAARHLGVPMASLPFGACQAPDADSEGGLAFERPAPFDAMPLGAGRGVALDERKCILCGLCLKACERVGCNRMGFIGRGRSLRVAVDEVACKGGASCGECGQCIAACPVGALSA